MSSSIKSRCVYKRNRLLEDKLLSKYPDMEGFILTSFSEIRGIGTLTETIATELKNRRDEIHGNPELRGILRLQIMALNSLEYKSQVCENYYKNYLYSVEPYQLPREVATVASRLAGRDIDLGLQGELVISYNSSTGFSVSRRLTTNIYGYAKLATNVELNARLQNVFAICEVSNTDTTSPIRQKCIAAFTLDICLDEIMIHLLEYEVNELFGAEDVYISKVGAAFMPPTLTTPDKLFRVTKFSIEKCGRDLFQPTVLNQKTVIRFI